MPPPSQDPLARRSDRQSSRPPSHRAGPGQTGQFHRPAPPRPLRRRRRRRGRQLVGLPTRRRRPRRAGKRPERRRRHAAPVRCAGRDTLHAQRTRPRHVPTPGTSTTRQVQCQPIVPRSSIVNDLCSAHDGLKPPSVVSHQLRLDCVPSRPNGRIRKHRRAHNQASPAHRRAGRLGVRRFGYRLVIPALDRAAGHAGGREYRPHSHRTLPAEVSEYRAE